MNRWLAALAACVLAAIVGLWRLSSRDGPARQAAPAVTDGARAPLPASRPSVRRGPSPALVAGTRQTPPPLPTSLEGTEVDGGFTVDARGRFYASDDVRRLFDYFLSTLGELELEEVRALVLAQARLELPNDAAVEAAMELFDRYLMYLEALQSVAEANGPAAAATLNDQFAQVEQLQTEVFDSATATAMFGQENRIARAVLTRNELGPRNSYRGDDYEQRMTEAESRLPPGVRAALARDRAVVRVREDVRRMRARGASEQEIWQLRARHFGAAAADRLAELDRDRDRPPN